MVLDRNPNDGLVCACVCKLLPKILVTVMKSEFVVCVSLTYPFPFQPRCLPRSTGGARVRPHRAGGHLRAGLPSDSGGPAVRAPAAAEEDQGEQVLAAPVEEVNQLQLTQRQREGERRKRSIECLQLSFWYKIVRRSFSPRRCVVGSIFFAV